MNAATGALVFGSMVTIIVALIGFSVKLILNRIDSLAVNLQSAREQIISDLRALTVKVDHQESRLTRLESWRELLTLPDTQRRHGRTESESDG